MILLSNHKRVTVRIAPVEILRLQIFVPQDYLTSSISRINIVYLNMYRTMAVKSTFASSHYTAKGSVELVIPIMTIVMDPEGPWL